MLRPGPARPAVPTGSAAPRPEPRGSAGGRTGASWRRRIPLGLIVPGLFALAFLLAGAGAVIAVRYYTHQRALDEAAAKAAIILDRNLATHHYFDHDLKPSIFELTDGFRPDNYFDPRWMSSTYAVKRIDDRFREISAIDYYYKEAAVNSRNPSNEADPAEAAFIAALNRDPDLEQRQDVQMIEGLPYYVLMHRGEVMEAICLQCHGDPADAPAGLVAKYGTRGGFGRQVGQTVSSIAIHVPLADAYALANRVSWQLSGLLLGLLAALFAATYWVQETLVTRPLRGMAMKSRQIVANEAHLGETLSRPAAGVELAELVDTFNALSIALRGERDGLAEHVRLRTTQLQHANLQLQMQVLAGERLSEELQASLSQKEVLLKEVHHRVKNNLQIVSSLLALQARSTRDPSAQQALIESQERVRALALVHQKLYGSVDLAHVELGDYLGTIIRQLVATSNVDHARVRTRLTAMPVRVEVDKVAPCGLIVTELVSNALKHAFPDGRCGSIDVQVEPMPDGRVHITVADDGPGLPPDLDLARSQSLGLRLVSILAKQLSADLRVDRTAGTAFHFSFTP